MLQVYDLTETEKWDAVVRSFRAFDVYWLSGYVRAFHLHGDGDPILFYYEADGTRGINVVMRRDVAKDRRFAGMIPENQYFDFATPYGYGGWLIEGEETAALFASYQAWCETNHIISEFVRFHPMLQNQVRCDGFYEVIGLGTVVHMDLSVRERIWDNMMSKNRNVIRKAIKNQVKIYHGHFPEIYETFRVIYNKTMDRDNANAYYYFAPPFYRSILEDLPQNAQVFFAEKDGTVIAASIILAANGRMNYHLSGSVREYSSLAATNLLLYEAALWGNANGFQTLYLGGGVGSSEDSLFKFKRAFYRGDLHRFYIGKKLYDQDRCHALVEMRKESISNRDYFPSYRG